MRGYQSSETVLRWILRGAVFLVFCAVSALILFLCAKGAGTLGPGLFFGDVPALSAIFGQRAVWDGIWPACAGTACLVLLTMLIATLPGVGCGIYLAAFCPPRRGRIFRTVLDVLAGTPSIVMGLFGFSFVLFLRNVAGINANTSLLLSAACLALLVLPVLVTSTCQALEALPGELALTAAALGFTRRQAVFRILLPASFSGIQGGIILSLGRAAEDTAVIMLTGVVANAGMPALFGKFEALPFYVYYISAQYQDPGELSRGFGAAIVLLLLSTLLLTLAEMLERRFRRRWGKTHDISLPHQQSPCRFRENGNPARRFPGSARAGRHHAHRQVRFGQDHAPEGAEPAERDISRLQNVGERGNRPRERHGRHLQGETPGQ